MTSTRKRPTGITILAVLWILGSLWNIYQGLNGIIVDLGVLPYLSDPSMHEWFRFGIPAETMIAFFVLAYGFLTILVVYGLWTARTWSYDFAFALPPFIIILNFAGFLLYLSSPPELELRAAADTVVPFIVSNLVFLVITWGYLSQTHVKQYLNKIPIPTPVAVPVPPPLASAGMSDEKKFCRYCGAEQKSDAVFCEKCGRKIG